jgi:hypothetical protein
MPPPIKTPQSGAKILPGEVLYGVSLSHLQIQIQIQIVFFPTQKVSPKTTKNAQNLKKNFQNSQLNEITKESQKAQSQNISRFLPLKSEDVVTNHPKRKKI